MLRRLAVVLLLALGTTSASFAQSIVTYAGGGSVDGQLLSDLFLTGASGIAFDASGNLLVTFRGGGQVLKVDATTGLVTTVAGNGASGFSGDGSLAVNASLRTPSGVVHDPAGNVYIADTQNGRIRRVDAKSGIITTYAGGGTPASGIGDGGAATAAYLGDPWGMAIDRGFLYITETAYNAHRVRRVDMSNGIITTIAGTTDGSLGDFAGDGGPAKDARLNGPFGIAADAAGNLYFNDRDNKRIRRIDTNGIITTYAGGGPDGAFADGIAATAADLDVALAVAFDRDGNLLLSSTQVGVRRVDKTTRIISTVFRDTSLILGMAVDAQGTIYFTNSSSGIARFRIGATAPEDLTGNGVFVGDGRSAQAAILHSPQGLALDRAENLYIVDQQASVIRRVDHSDGSISTVAGRVGGVYAPPEQEGTPATEASIGYPTDIAFDGANNLYIADELNGKVWRVDGAGKITTFAGGGSPADGSGDGGLATAANIVPWGIGFDRAGNLLIADYDAYNAFPRARIRRVDAGTRMITTIAGGAAIGYAGDGGLATQAKLDRPLSAVDDAAGNIFISDSNNGAIRRIDHATGIITTFAGGPNQGDALGDGGPAAQARITPLHLQFDRANGDLYAADFSSHRIRKFDRSGTVSTVAGSALFYFEGGFGGDNGPALQARLSFDYGDVSGVAIDAAGDVFFSDSQNNRVRAVLACHAVGAPQLTSPANNAVNTSTAPRLVWSRVDFAFRYDVRLDTANPPIRTIATNVDETSFTPSNLQAGTKYFWQVVAKGDSYCARNESSPSTVNTFTTGTECGAGTFDLITPADGSAGLTTPVHLQWQASAGSSTYDLYFGAANPPPLFASGLTATSFDVSISGTAYWFVVAHAGCDATKTATSSIRSFATPVFGNCGIVAPGLSAASPANGATNVALTTDLTWTAIGLIEAFDVYFGTTSTPGLISAGLPPSARSLTLPSLATGTKYYWTIVARGACLPTLGLATPTQSFTTRADCPTPGAPSILFAPATATVGSTYAIVWSSAATLGDDGGYLVERSLSPSFVPVLDAQVTGSTAASFLATSAGTIYHRVRAVPGCDTTKTGPPSGTEKVVIAEARPNVIFTVQPQAVVTSLGERLEDRRGSFTLENIGSNAVQVIVGQSNIDSPPFFDIVGQTAFLTLEPRKPRTFTIRFGGPPNNVAGSYQGVVFVAATGQDNLVVTPYAFVNLRVGTGPAGVPKFIVDGVPSDYAAFPGFAGKDDANRPARQVTIRNDGTAPMELAAEIGPEVWLAPKSDWNSQPLAPGASRTIDLFTQRERAPNSSPLPRYTYFTVRTKAGATARLLVQDSDAVAVRGGRATGLDVTARSFVIPDVASVASARGTRLVTRARLSNLGGDAVQAELIFTPAERDGFDAANVRRAVVVVPANDVVTITDPIVQLFGLTAPARGQIEVRLPRERVGLVTVRSSIVPLGAPGGFDTPVVSRSDGARSGSPHVIYLPPSSTISLTLAETSGNDGASVQVRFFNAQGTLTSVVTASLQRYSATRIDRATASRIEIVVDSGGGSVTGLATIANATGEGGATIPSRPAGESAAAPSAMRRAYATEAADHAVAPGDVVGTAVTPVSVTTVVPLLGTGSTAYKTSVGFVAPASVAATFTATLHGSGGGLIGNTRTVTVPAGGTQFYNDIIGELFGATSAQGSVFVSAPSTSKVYAVVNSGSGTPAPTSYINLPTTLSEALTSVAGAALRPLAYDGLEQTADATKGDHWLLVLNEVAGGGGNVNVRLYEAANRTSPIAEKDFGVVAYQQLTLDSIFGAMGLEAADRLKDRTNVQVVVTATGGGARLSATAVAVSVETGEARSFALAPAVGSGTPNINFVAPIATPGATPPPPHRRIAGH